MFGRMAGLATTTIAALSLHSGIADANPSAAHAGPTIVFVGNHAESSSALIAAIDWPFDASGALLQETFERDLLLVSSYYWDHGYASVKVGVPVVTPGLVTIPIEEGPKFSINAVTAKGDLLEPEATMLAGLRTHGGDVFSRTNIAADREELTEHYQDRGYAYANVLPLTRVDLDKRTIALTWEISRGKRAFIEDVEVDARTPGEASAIRRVLPMSSGDQFSNADIREAKQRAEAIAGTSAVVSTKRGSTDELVKVVVEIPAGQ
jgi:outer membrane protein insertion porin family